MTELRGLEEMALLVMALSLAIASVVLVMWPEYYHWPDWIITVLWVVWIIGFFRWVVTGGIPPSFSGRT